MDKLSAGVAWIFKTRWRWVTAIIIVSVVAGMILA